MRAIVVVLGDLGRSPRMQYHALALAANGVDVDVVGYAGAPPRAEIVAHPRITCHLVRPLALRAWPRLPRALFVPAAVLDTVIGALSLLRTLLRAIARPHVVLVQNPPAIPTLPVALLAARAHGARLVVDWHNLGHTMLALRLGNRHPAVGLARRCELLLGRRAHAHLCVSRAMQTELVQHGQLRDVTVFRDRPAASFTPVPLAEREALRRWLCEELGVPGASGAVALVVSPTSWTDDEDFDLLLDALPLCDRSLRGPVLVLLTGNGPRRATFERRAGRLALRRVHVRTHWLPAEQYPRVLGAADLGLCLHRSSSGLDLPMKVADMLGAGVPVLAFDYGPCLGELLRHGDNALLFTDAQSLAASLGDVLEQFPERSPLLERLRGGVERSRGVTWEEGWAAEAWPVLRGE